MVLTGKPIILSTGLSTFEEVKNAISFIESIDSSYIIEKKLALLQCTSMYPIPFEDANLNIMDTYRKNFDIPIGYSDHTTDMDAIEIAIAMGADIIEVHFTDSRKGKEFRDNKVSATKNEIQALIKKTKKIKTIQGVFEKKPTKSEIESGHISSFRRGIYTKRELQVGETIQEEDLITLRPLVGVGAENFYDVIGTKVNKDMEVLDSIEND